MDQLIEEFVKLLPVLVGAMIALFGAAVRYVIERRDKRIDIRRAKLERLTDLAYRVKAWTSSLDSHVAFGLKDEPQIESPIEELQVLADVYFPELHDSASVLAAAAKRYAGMTYEIGSSRVKDGRAPDDANQKIRDAYQPIVDAIDKLSKEIRVLARDLK